MGHWRGLSSAILSGCFAALSGFFGKISFDPALVKSTFPLLNEAVELNVRVSEHTTTYLSRSFLLLCGLQSPFSKHVSMAVDFISNVFSFR